MSINLTDEIEVKTKKGKLGAAKQIFLEGDTTSLQKEHEDNQAHFDTLDNRSAQMEETIKSIAATGGASQATAVTYNNDASRLNAVNAQAAIDEVSSIAHFAKRGAGVNISTNYNSDHIVEVLTLSQALSKVPRTDRVLGFQGKYLASDGWHTIIYIGNSLTDWGDTTKWTDLADKVFNSISKNATFAGIATPTTNPGTPDGPVFYFAPEGGVYSNFGINKKIYENAFLIYTDKWRVTYLNNNIYIKNPKVGTCISGVYVFGNKDKIDELINSDAKLVFASISADGFNTIVDSNNGDKVIFISQGAFENIREFHSKNNEIIIYICTANLNRLSSTIYNVEINKDVFLKAKDTSVLSALTLQYKYWDFKASSSCIRLPLSRITNISIRNRVEGKDYYVDASILSDTHPSHPSGIFARLSEYTTGATVSIAKAYIPKEDIGKINRITISGPNNLLATFDVFPQELLNDEVGDHFTYKPKLSEIVYIDNGISKEDFNTLSKELKESIGEETNTLIDLKGEIYNQQQRVTTNLSTFQSEIAGIKSIVDNINAEEITELYNSIVENYNKLSSDVASNKTELTNSISALSASIAKDVELLKGLIANKNTEIADKEITLPKLSDSLKDFITSSGGGNITNFPDEKTLTQKGNLLSIKDIDKTDNREIGIQRIDSLPSELKPFTKYLITDNIEPDASIQLPIGSKFTPMGGMVNATIMNSSLEKVHSSDLGMVPNDPAYGIHNFNILKKVIKNKYSLILDGVYNIDNSGELLDIDYKFHLYGGGLIMSRTLFKLIAGSSLFMDSVELRSAGNKIYAINNSIDFIIDELIFTNCKFYKIGIYCNGLDVDPAKIKTGINKVIIQNSYFESCGSTFIINDLPIWEQALVQNNVCTKMDSVFFNSSTTNEYTYEHNFLSYIPVVISGNTFIGIPDAKNSSYLCSVLLEHNVAIMCNNYIKNMINTNAGGTAYDAYLSCKNVYIYNNYYENILNLAKVGSDGTSPATHLGLCEIFKSKGAGGLRYICNNYVKQDTEFLKSLGAKEEALFIALFQYTSPVDSVIFNNNTLDLGDCSLLSRSSGMQQKEIIFKNNIIKARNIVSGEPTNTTALNKSGTILLTRSDSAKEVSVIATNNQILFKEPSRFCLFRASNDAKVSLCYLKDNLFSNNEFFYSEESGENYGRIIRKNTVLDDTIYRTNNYRKLLSGNYEETIRLSSKDNSFYVISISKDCYGRIEVLAKPTSNTSRKFIIKLLEDKTISCLLSYFLNGEKKSLFFKMRREGNSLFFIDAEQKTVEFPITGSYTVYNVDGFTIGLYAGLLEWYPKGNSDVYTDASFMLTML